MQHWYRPNLHQNQGVISRCNLSISVACSLSVYVGLLAIIPYTWTHTQSLPRFESRKWHFTTKPPQYQTMWTLIGFRATFPNYRGIRITEVRKRLGWDVWDQQNCQPILLPQYLAYAAKANDKWDIELCWTGKYSQWCQCQTKHPVMPSVCIFHNFFPEKTLLLVWLFILCFRNLHDILNETFIETQIKPQKTLL